MERKNKIAAGFAFGVFAMLCLGIALGASSIGPWPITGNLPCLEQGRTLSVSSGTTTVGHFSFVNSGSAALSGGTTCCCLSSGGTATTSIPCNYLQLQLAGTGVLSTGGSTGIAFMTSGTAAGGLGTLTLSTSGTPIIGPMLISVPTNNLNSLYLTGTGSCGFLYGN